MPLARPLPCLLVLALLGPVLPGSALLAADPAERETTRYNEAVTRLVQTRDEAQAIHKAKAILALTAVARARAKAEDAAGTAEAWRAVLVIDREHADARTYFTALGTLAAVLEELDAKPTDLLGTGPEPGDTKDTEKAP